MKNASQYKYNLTRSRRIGTHVVQDRRLAMLNGCQEHALIVRALLKGYSHELISSFVNKF